MTRQSSLAGSKSNASLAKRKRADICKVKTGFATDTKKKNLKGGALAKSQSAQAFPSKSKWGKPKKQSINYLNKADMS